MADVTEKLEKKKKKRQKQESNQARVNSVVKPNILGGAGSELKNS